MTAKDIAKLGKLLIQFLACFASCFARPQGRRLLNVYVRGLLSGVQRKNAEAIAQDQRIAPRTLQRFLESIVWDEEKLRDRCQQIVATEHASSEAIGCLDETGTAKCGNHTAGVKRQYNGNRGKIENCVNNVALAYSAPGFHCLLDLRLYLPKEWTQDPARRKKLHPRRGGVPNETADRLGPCRSGEAQRHRSDGLDSGRTLRPRWCLSGWTGRTGRSFRRGDSAQRARLACEANRAEETACQPLRSPQEVPATTQTRAKTQRSPKPGKILTGVSRAGRATLSDQGCSSWQ